ncbi:hypothetical protein U27_00470 [Candidatus Vecturithrix granuli]|uniref:site-specific DNA-methyltransferase (adenine-specific) n=1 Tax=Vecturithrix granuli TaxID=1499967 RepID=A0A081C7L8_VECG1|nr:hypothetical protein U27_00470 [Candidatus Vecturithrix granuli]
MSVPDKILQLVERFDRNIEAYKHSHYNETQTRQEFIDPLFKSLGWDMDNEQGYAEAYKDVVHEDAIKIGRATKAPDYSFRIGGVRKFFVEAKKPSVDIKEDIHPAYQLRRYAWSAKLALSILTDFEEFAVYDCRVKPEKTDKASKARTLYLTYRDYLQRWDELAAIFSREAILKGSFDKYAESHKEKRGTTEVDVAFLQEIERWRDLLARNIALRNPRLTRRELNFAVQRTIDRIIFLRICEDRGIENYGKLMALQNGTQIYQRLLHLFYQADDRYNSGIFHFKSEKERTEAPDTLTPDLTIDDAVLKDMLKNLYYPDSPYEFSVLPADILGQVYEQFLGKVIRLTAGHQAKVEEKPEVKKAGGVYYTPTYIVEYIIKHTVGELLKRSLSGVEVQKSPKQAEKLTILDPACGSGSFLLGAYQYLLDWYHDAYLNENPEKWSKGRQPRLYQNDRGEWKLTIEERKRILLNHIYGVDIDSQAVEVTKLSLLLKVLEGEDEQTLNSQMALFQQRVLPDLSNNIISGNSLIGSDFYEGQQLLLLDEEEMYRVNAFDWEKEFPEIMQKGGFDAVIGNPPYIRIQTLKEWIPLEVEFYKRKYVAASKGNYDIYVVFVECGLGLLNLSGKLGFILPSKFLSTDYGLPLRNLLSSQRVVERIVDFGHEQVFQNATTYTCLLFLAKTQPKEFSYINVSPHKLFEVSQSQQISSQSIDNTQWVFVSNQGNVLLQKLSAKSQPFIHLFSEMSRGISTGADDIFCLVETKGQLFTKHGSHVEVESEILRRPLYATDFTRYLFQPQNKERIIFPYHVSENRSDPIEESVLRKKYPNTYQYLSNHRKKLEARKQCRIWYGYSAPRSLHIHERADIIVPLLANHGLCVPAPQKSTHFCMMASAGFSIRLKHEIHPMNPFYILGLINSKLLFWNLRLISNKFRGGWITCTKQYFAQLPIRIINFSNPADKAYHDKIVELVERMLDLHKQLHAAKTPQAQTLLQRQIDAADRQIDRLVYELYGLTEEEIEIIEDKREK